MHAFIALDIHESAVVFLLFDGFARAQVGDGLRRCEWRLADGAR